VSHIELGCGANEVGFIILGLLMCIWCIFSVFFYIAKQQSCTYSHVLPYKSEVFNNTYTIACTTCNIRVQFDLRVHWNIQCLQQVCCVLVARPRPLAYEYAFSYKKADEKQGIVLEVATTVLGNCLSTCGRLKVTSCWDAHRYFPSMATANFLVLGNLGFLAIASAGRLHLRQVWELQHFGGHF